MENTDEHAEPVLYGVDDHLMTLRVYSTSVQGPTRPLPVVADPRPLPGGCRVPGCYCLTPSHTLAA